MLEQSTQTVSSEPTIEEKNSKEFSCEVIIESETYSENGYFLSWYNDIDELVIGLLPSEFVTKYNYPQGVKVKIEAINDGSVTTISGKEAYNITSIEYLEDIDEPTEDEPTEDEPTVDDVAYAESIEGTTYVEEQMVVDGETYVVFGFEFDPGYYYYGKISDPIENMIGNNYYFYANYNDGDLRDGKQYCEVTSWKDYSYDSTYVEENIVEGTIDDYYSATENSNQLIFDSELFSAVDCEISYESGVCKLSGNIKNISTEWWAANFMESIYIKFQNIEGKDIGMAEVSLVNVELFPDQLESFSVTEQLSENPAIFIFTYIE